MRTLWLVGLTVALRAQDIEGIELGMPLKDALMALKQDHPNLKLAPDRLSYPGMAEVLTYGLNAVGSGEGFYFLLTMPPNSATVSKVTWVVHYGETNIPTQDAVVANLVRKYGRPSSDTTTAALSLGSRDLFWIKDANGNPAPGPPVARCLGQSTFYMNGLMRGSRTQWDPVDVRLPRSSARLRIEQGFVNKEDPIADQCAHQSIVHARLFRARVMGVIVPNLVEYAVLLMGSGPADQRATEATHLYWRDKSGAGNRK